MIFLLVTVLVLQKSIYSSIISKSNIQICSQTTTNNSDLKCQTKLVISLSIENGKLNDTDYLETYISDATQIDGTDKTLQNPFKINISKSPVYAYYPSIYFQDFNFKPVEQIITSDVFSCSDGDLSSNPTCGWVLSQKGSIIPYSQGFCCKCDFSQIIGIDTSTRSRGSTCDLLNIGTGSASAHCLKFDQLWYSAYQIKPYQIDYSINIYVTYNNNNNMTGNNYTTENLTLSPSNYVSTSNHSDIIAKLIGDFSPASPPNDFTQYYLTIPTYPTTHTMVLEGPINWMLIPQSYFTLDGSVCNKIGIGYYAFRTQNLACQVAVGECLHNQIYDYYLSDLQLISSGKSPRFLISQDPSIGFNFYSYSGNNKKFGYKLTGVYNSLITLEIVADDIQYVINVSTGTIDYFTIQTFESLSTDGSIQIQVTNTGNLTALFYLSFNCSSYILPVAGTSFSLSAFQSTIIVNDIYTLNQDNRTHQCNATLKDSLGKIDDIKINNFNTTQTEKVNIQNGNNTITNSNVTAYNNSQSIPLDCQTLCPDFFGFVCFIDNSCWGYFARIIGVILIILFILVCIIKWIKGGCSCKLFNKIYHCLFGNTDEKENIKKYYNKNFKNRI